MKFNNEKRVIHIFNGNETMDGAGVRLRRMFGGPASVALTDPFLLLDHFGSNNPADYLSGFPWHPHRGIETVTFLMEGKVDHEDSEGHRGTIYPDDIQWMTAGSGIFHQEMPKPIDDKDPMEVKKRTGMPTSVVGLQLWINLPASEKMTVPSYRSITGKITPLVEDDYGNKIRIVAGSFGKDEGVLKGRTEIDPTYLEIRMPSESEFMYQPKQGYNTIINTLAGKISVRSGDEINIGQNSALIFSRDGCCVSVKTKESPARFILLSGRPLNEPVYWYGPIVMNTPEQINEALLDLRRNNFVRVKEPIFQ